DPYQSAHLTQRLAERSVPTDEYVFHPASVARLATTLLSLIREHALALPEDEELIDELQNVRVRESSPGVSRLDHDQDRHDDRAIALALAASAVLQEMGRWGAAGSVPVLVTVPSGSIAAGIGDPDERLFSDLAAHLGVPYTRGREQ